MKNIITAAPQYVKYLFLFKVILRNSSAQNFALAAKSMGTYKLSRKESVTILHNQKELESKSEVHPSL